MVFRQIHIPLFLRVAISLWSLSSQLFIVLLEAVNLPGPGAQNFFYMHAYWSANGTEMLFTLREITLIYYHFSCSKILVNIFLVAGIEKKLSNIRSFSLPFPAILSPRPKS